VILNIKPYEKDDGAFGNNFGVIDYNGQLINIVTRFDDIKESTNALLESGMKLITI